MAHLLSASWNSRTTASLLLPTGRQRGLRVAGLLVVLLLVVLVCWCAGCCTRPCAILPGPSNPSFITDNRLGWVMLLQVYIWLLLR